MTEFKVGNKVLLKNHAPTSVFHTKYKPSFRIYKWISDKALDVHDSTGRSYMYLYSIMNYCIFLNMF